MTSGELDLCVALGLLRPVPERPDTFVLTWAGARMLGLPIAPTPVQVILARSATLGADQ